MARGSLAPPELAVQKCLHSTMKTISPWLKACVSNFGRKAGSSDVNERKMALTISHWSGSFPQIVGKQSFLSCCGGGGPFSQITMGYKVAEGNLLHLPTPGTNLSKFLGRRKARNYKPLPHTHVQKSALSFYSL